MPTGVIDQDPAHDLRRDAKEMASILPIDLALVDEPDVHLMNKRRRLQGVVGALAPKLARGNAAKLPVDERQQGTERSRSPRLQSPSSAVTSRGEARSLLQTVGSRAQHSTGRTNYRLFVALTRSGHRLRDLHTAIVSRASTDAGGDRSLVGSSHEPAVTPKECV